MSTYAFNMETTVELDRDEITSLLREIADEIESGNHSGYPCRDDQDGGEEQIGFWSLS